MGRPRSHDCRNPRRERARFWSLLVPLVVPLVGLLVVLFGEAIVVSIYFGGVIIVVAWCACLCLAVHAVQHGSGNRCGEDPYQAGLLWDLYQHPLHERRLQQPAIPASRPEHHTPLTPDWRVTRARLAQLRSEYGQFECDPLAMLRLPALADVTVASTGRFVDAFAEAQALDTDTEPPAAHRARFVSAVDEAWRAWRAARDAAGRIRLSGIPAEERATVRRAIRLLNLAQDSDHDAERAAAYAKARAELAKLERCGTGRARG
ncbi:MAG: hypothetical protein ACRDST_22180 [Pseudonocardiaceae bacterium]